MYHLTKKFDENFNIREKVFKNILKFGLTNENILNYRNIKFKEFEKYNKKTAVNLGKELNNFLVAFTLKAILENYKIISNINLCGNYFFNKEKFYWGLCDALIMSLKNSNYKKIYLYIRIRNSKIIVKIKFIGNLFKKIPAGYKAYKEKNSIVLYTEEKITPCDFGEYENAWYFLSDNLSPINLVFKKTDANN